MTHKEDSDGESITVRQGHYETFEGLDMNPRCYEDIDEADTSDSKHHKLVSCIFAKGFDETVTRGTVAGVTVGLENRKDGPVNLSVVALTRSVLGDRSWVPCEHEAEPVRYSPCYKKQPFGKHNTYSLLE